MTRKILIASLFSAILLFCIQPLHAQGWSLIKDSNGIKLFERPISGTDLMEYMAVGTIDARIEVIGEALRDISTWKDWVADCKGTQLLKQITRDDMIVYLVLEPPVIDDRDVIIKDKTTYDYEGGKAVVDFAATSEMTVPIQEGRIRVTIMNGVFDMEFLGREKTKFCYYLKTDPAGDIAKSVAYAVMKNYPYDSISDLRKVVKDKKFADRAKGSEIEKRVEAIHTNEGHVRRIFTARLGRLVKNKAALAAIMGADKENFKAIMGSHNSYPAFEKAAEEFVAQYLDKTTPGLGAKLKSNKKFKNELIDLICTDSQARTATVEDIAAKYK